MCDIELGDIDDIDQSQCHNACGRERNTNIMIDQCHLTLYHPSATSSIQQTRLFSLLWRTQLESNVGILKLVTNPEQTKKIKSFMHINIIRTS